MRLTRYSFHKQKKPELCLPFSDPASVVYRDFVNSSASRLGVHERLICYWDQIWVLLATPESEVYIFFLHLVIRNVL